MSFTKIKIYNIALSALLLSRQIIDIDTDPNTNEINVLNTFWDVALESTLQDLDLDSTSQPITLELLEALEDEPWEYAYKYPNNCLFLRRIQSGMVTDVRSTHISKRTGIHDGQKVIFTNESQAVAECVPKDVPLEALNAMAGMAVAYRLAILSAPLIVGKGAKALKRDIETYYALAKSEAQETDSLENFNYEAEWQRSEFVEARLS